jgi:hypothetical protein
MYVAGDDTCSQLEEVLSYFNIRVEKVDTFSICDVSNCILPHSVLY